MAKNPTLIIITGFPATGKTTFARKLSSHFNFPLICVDTLKEMMFDRIGNWEDMKLFDSVSKASYDVMYHTIGLMLSSGQSCIIEAFLRAEMAEPRIAEIKEKYNCRILLFQFNCDANKLIERYESRHNSNERHPCHPGNIPKEEFIKLNGKSPMIKIDGETIIIDTTDFNQINFAEISDKIKKFIGWDKNEYLKSLPTKRIAAGILLFNEDGKLLILKPTYKEGWTIPGGVVEQGESLIAGIRREMKEEIGIEAEIENLLVVDSKSLPKDGFIDDSLQIVFRGKNLTKVDIEKIKLPDEELSEYRFVDWEEAIKLLGEHMAKRLRNISKEQEDVVLMRNGKIEKL